eukprot:357393-Chlamydomonas_euryale.AAC.3
MFSSRHLRAKHRMTRSIYTSNSSGDAGRPCRIPARTLRGREGKLSTTTVMGRRRRAAWPIAPPGRRSRTPVGSRQTMGRHAVHAGPQAPQGVAAQTVHHRGRGPCENHVARPPAAAPSRAGCGAG